MSAGLILKREKGWFAAGVEVEKALGILSDGAFKLFIHLSLLARRDQGVLQISQLELAKSLQKGTQTIRHYLREMETAGICRLSGFEPKPFCRGLIEITDDYWPYERGQECERDDPELRSYLDRIREIVEERACIRKPLPTSDELLAREWYKQGVTLEHVGQAILMGCGRKYVSWRNGAPHTPIGSLAYFETILGEVQEQKTSPEYWEYTRHRIERMEKLWISGKDPDRLTRPWCKGEKVNTMPARSGND